MNKKPLFIALATTSIGIVATIIVASRYDNSSNMVTSDNGRNLIKKFEGCSLTAYQDSVGVWTIGYGHTANVYYGETITSSEADALLASDLKTFENGVNKYTSGVSLTQNQFDALVSFSYNVGLANLKNSTLLKKVKANPKDKAIETEFRRWVYAGGKILQGLVNRRAEEAKLYFT